MHHAFLLAAVALLPSGVLCQNDGLYGLDDVDQQIEDFERLALGIGEHHPHHRRHHPHRRHHLRSHKRHSLLVGAPTVVNPAAPPSDDLLPGRHPSVETKLHHMDQEMHELTGRHQASSIARSALEDNVKKAVSHMNTAVVIQRELARTEAAIRAEELKLKRLEDDRLRLDRTHGHLVSSLHHIMEPKIHFAETRLKQKEDSLQDLEANAAKWNAEEKRYHDTSLATIAQRKEAKVRLETADENEKKAIQEREQAKKEFETVKRSVAFNVEGYQYAQANAAASTSKEQRGEETVRLAKRSLKRMQGIMNMEQRRVDESMGIGKDRVQGKIGELANVHERSKKKLSKLREELNIWRHHERDMAQQVAEKKRLAQEASQSYAEHQQAILTAANDKAAYDAESDSDWAWGEWPSAHKRDTDELDLSSL